MRFFLSFLLLFLASGVLASSLEVRVVDPQGAGVRAASVHLARRDAAWRTSVRVDDEGHYRFDALTSGVYLVQAEAGGFTRSEAMVLRLVEGESASLELRLDLAVFEESIVVTSAAAMQRPSEVTKTMTVVDKKQFESRDEYFIPEALRTVPGLKVQQLGGPGSFTSIKIRGLRSEDTAIVIDGARIRDPSAPQGDASSYLEMFMATDLEQVEILRGTGSTLYGTNAGGGVINIVTSSGGGKPRGAVLAEGGGLGLVRASAQTAGGFRDRFQYSVGLSHLNVADGVDGNDSVRNTSVQGRAQMKLGPTSSLSFRFYGADTRVDLNESPEALGELPPGVIDAVADVNYVPGADDPDSQREANFTSALVSFEQRPREDFGYSIRYHGLLTDRSFFDGPEGVSAFEPATSSLSEFEGAIHTLSARTDFTWGRHQLIQAGFELERESFVNRSFPDDPTGNARTNVAQTSESLYVQDQLTLAGGALQIAGALRAQWFSPGDPELEPADDAPYTGMEFSSLDNAWTGDISGSYGLESGTKLLAHFGSGYRAPSLFERYGTSFSSFGYLAYGDPRLRPEKTMTFDVGVEQSLWSQRARVSATYFRTRLKEIIIFDFSGAINPETDPFGRFGGYLSTDGGTTKGVELAGNVVVGRGLHLNTSYTYTDAEPPTGVSEDQTQAFVVPKHQLSFVATQLIGPRLTVSFDLVASSRYLAPIFDTATFTSRVYRFDSFVKSDLAASYRFPVGMRLFGKIENLFDQQIFESGFRTPGRYALVGAAFEF
ncbi:MAG: TonB-dependent receptor [Acidobacteriota bacterium]|nr:MAG: TonB-dependent receptor [Acidobacteriota bacterium]